MNPQERRELLVVYSHGSEALRLRILACGAAEALGLGFPLYRRGRRTSGPGPWLEKTIWADVRRFHSDPGAVLERVRDQLASDGTQAELEARHADKTDRLAAAHKERDRWLHLYAQGHLEEHEFESHLADLRVHLDSLKVPVSSVEEELEAQHEHARVAETAEAWLMSLRERVEEIEDDSLEAYKVRRQLVQLLVERIVVGRDENGDTSVRITYRFGPPEPPGTEEPFVTGVNNACPTHAHHTGMMSATNSRTPAKEWSLPRRLPSCATATTKTRS